MKQRLLLYFVLLLPYATIAQIYTVCNLNGIVADYKNLQGAIDSVPSGSTLYVFPSANDYGNIVIAKRIYIVGTGFMLDQNSNPYASPNKTGVTLTSVNLSAGSDFSYLVGLQITGHTNPHGANRISINGASNVTISRCMMDELGGFEIYTANTINCTIIQCYIFLNSLLAPTDTYAFYQDQGSQNFIFTNNIIDDRYGFNVVTINRGTVANNVSFNNNTFIAQLSNSNFGNFNYTNNIFVNSHPVNTYTMSDVSMNGFAFNNIVTDSFLFSGTTHNFIGAKPDSIFTGFTFGYHSWDQKWQIVPGSFVNTYAADGGQAGAFGTTNPYILSGIPDLPSIYGISISPDPVNHGNVLVHIQAKASYR